MKPIIHNYSIPLATFKFILISSFFCFSLISFRVLYTQSIYFLFLVWNLVLAFIPLGISSYILGHSKLKKPFVLILLIVWLLFLPNAPYIITDFIHLQRSHTYFIWLDVLVIGSFAFVGLTAFYLSISNFKVIIATHFKVKLLKPLLVLIYFLCGFGIYLGRYLRFNSWDIISQPKQLLYYIFEISLINVDKNMYVYTFFFGSVLWASHILLDQIRSMTSH
ncbi:DUF1361 domain-containing protein [Aurantibacter aestuarii]|uniref:DUF1361 domain-containing protein n=1 Tax=Aurantibacter aestuarii TaxID=1266046 RepID=A0A2T1N4L0_9FLAO|nr:DUF1361 domain-containing protein [Aurantibacter aestuarii]PSG86059.1 DUF1361 domain-containing protein [Aurantibacter aestuarii]